jgi:hypothetical protein
MTSSSQTESNASSSGQNSMIHTAGCIIIGDEVLGGKVSLSHDSVLRKCRRRSE